MSTPLKRQGSLAECEEIIEKGLATFIEVGAALLQIRDERLYLETHKTFDDYCRERWDFTDRRARQLMTAAEVGTIVPVANEAQARELVPLKGDEAEMIAVFRDSQAKAQELGEPLTAEQIKKHVRIHVERGEGRRERAQHLEEIARQPCFDCGRTHAELEADGVFMSSGFFWKGHSHSPDADGWVGWGNEGPADGRCRECWLKHEQQEREAREREWDALSEDEREERRQAKAKERAFANWLRGYDLLRLLKGEGQGGVADTVRCALEWVQELDTDDALDPDLPAALASVARDIEDAARELREHCESVDAKTYTRPLSRTADQP
jgi:hypothetical protein